MPKLQATLFLVSQLMSNGLKVHFNLNEYFVKACNNEAIATMPCKGNLYEMNFTKVHKRDVANLVQSPMKDGALELRDIRVVHSFSQSHRLLRPLE